MAEPNPNLCDTCGHKREEHGEDGCEGSWWDETVEHPCECREFIPELEESPVA